MTPSRRPAIREHEAGVSLIEILIALGIMAIGLASIFAVMGFAFKAHKQGVDRVHASLLAQKIASEMESWQWGDIAINPTGLKDPAFPDSYSVDLESVPIGDFGDTFRVTITVRWQVRGRDRTEQFLTVVRRRFEPE